MPGSWVEERARFLVGLLGERGLTMSLEASRVLVANQVEHVCQQMSLRLQLVPASKRTLKLLAAAN